MMRSMYTAATGMKGQQLYMDTISNNLSNVNTNTYKRQNIQFKDLMYQTIKEPGTRNPEGSVAPAGIQVGLGVRTGAITRNFEQGSLKNTGNDTDVAIKGEGFFQVALPGGGVAYTRDGQFHRSSDGVLRTSEGHPVYPEIIIPEGYSSIEISAEGHVIAVSDDADDSRNIELGQFELAQFINPSGLNSIGNNLYLETEGSGMPLLSTPGRDGMGELAHQHVEGSNVDMVDEMVGMISAQRAYEIVSKAITTSEDMLQTATGLKR
ncbi:flagellar basal-body rod protein FlgG [Chitinivibrio alkaliphilus]|uniref:Flagellar basal-body rod protein FlgG n=1 Tax=Chitinivibrio alkaliphilus ACht1 TaxID=1313304 RepID=U7DCR9_9BACT|nr:flagellar basal-body rod protein FlgG [Chitinivibrio alkaliphilus]ERP39358.1 flagellar basal-body rod protein FlgG [Chitinivibrio alkaliphilus ACht1]